MPTILTADALIGMLKQSGLISEDELQSALTRWRTDGVDISAPRTIAVQLVKENLLTRWQAEKLLQGKHRGFFLGKYRLLTLLGTGGMSSVYLAEHMLMRRQVAIKVLPQSRIEDASYLERFHREAQAVAALDHPNIVRAYDVNQEGNVHFLVMEYVAGQSLQELVADNRPLGFVQATEYIRQVATGLEHAHAAGLIHRDIKPANLLVDERGVVKMLDLGLARFFHTEEESPLTLKYDEKVLGTADYLSPEQALDSHDVDTRADIYSLGCTMYFLLTGHPPFPEGTLAQRLMFHQMKEPAPLKTERPDTPPEIVEFVEKMMRKAPDERYQTVREIADTCKEWLKINGGRTWKNMQAAARAPAPSTSSKSGASKSAALKATTKSKSAKRNISEDVTVQASPPPREHDSEMAAFLAAMSGDESPATADASTVAATSPPLGIPVHNLDGAQRGPQTAAQPPAAAPVAGHIAEVAEEVDEIPEFDFTRETAGPVSTRTNVIKGGSSRNCSVLADSQASQGISTIARWRMSSLSLMRRRPKLAIGISVTTLLLGMAIIFMGTNGGSAPPPGDPSPDKDPAAETTTPIATYTKLEKTIGPEGDFSTIAAALDFAAKHTARDNRNARIVFTLEPGQTFAERIVIDNTDNDKRKVPQGIHFVVKDGTCTLAPAGTEPVVQIIAGSTDKTDVEFLHLEGFNIEAPGRDVAVELTGVLPRCEFRRMKITGYQQTGIAANSARSFINEELVFADVTFQDAAPDSVAVKFAYGKTERHEPSNIRFERCRFLGPMRNGIECAAPVIAIDIQQSIFFNLDAGINLNYEGDEPCRMKIANNTFRECRDGIRIDHLDKIDYGLFRIDRNAFSQTGVAPVRIIDGFSEPQFLQKDATDGTNWTDQPINDSSANVFRHGRSEAEFQFQSLDPADPGFLLPVEGSGHEAIGASQLQRTAP